MPEYREATFSDLPAIFAIGEEVNAMHHRAWPHVFAPPGLPERDLAHWSESVGKDEATTFLAVEAGRIAGFVTLAIVNQTNSLLQPLRYARVGSIGVTVALRGQGIGPKLMALAEEWARERGASELTLNVWAFNEHALHMYKELGYEVRAHLMGKRFVAPGV